MSIKILFMLMIPIAIETGCKLSSTNNLKIEGAWSFIRNDSLYYEIIFDQDRFYTYDENHGDYFGSYKIIDDTIQFYNQYHEVTLAGQISSFNENKFFLKTKYYNA